jgi:hypothetical protein
LFLPVVERLAAVSGKGFVGPVARKRHGDMFARQLRHAVGRQRRGTPRTARRTSPQVSTSAKSIGADALRW